MWGKNTLAIVERNMVQLDMFEHTQVREGVKKKCAFRLSG